MNNTNPTNETIQVSIPVSDETLTVKKSDYMLLMATILIRINQHGYIDEQKAFESFFKAVSTDNDNLKGFKLETKEVYELIETETD